MKVISLKLYGEYDPLVGTAGFKPVEGVSADRLGRFDSYTFSPTIFFHKSKWVIPNTWPPPL